jgi:hypothetical protein
MNKMCEKDLQILKVINKLERSAAIGIFFVEFFLTFMGAAIVNEFVYKNASFVDLLITSFVAWTSVKLFFKIYHKIIRD